MVPSRECGHIVLSRQLAIQVVADVRAENLQLARVVRCVPACIAIFAKYTRLEILERVLRVFIEVSQTLQSLFVRLVV